MDDLKSKAPLYHHFIFENYDQLTGTSMPSQLKNILSDTLMAKNIKRVCSEVNKFKRDMLFINCRDSPIKLATDQLISLGYLTKQMLRACDIPTDFNMTTANYLNCSLSMEDSTNKHKSY